ncbi:MAG: orotate phosphoribosyltransferase [Candidatus Eremiobacteraeota bacterium]|nr:orotate phosphoribosyltransferase [Candidatus Eremiobacteraeota bacterium]NNM92814.1 orotate phosphoribosyltransferase [Candidatus Eremiobacteraeota bacterium]
MDAARLREALVERGAVLEGHFRLSSGRHSDRFVQKFRILEEPKLVAPVAQAIAARFAAERPTIVVSAAVGGIVLGYEVARALGLRAIFAEKEAGVPVLRRGFALGPEDRALVVEDVVTTGGSVREVLELVRAHGATCVGVGAIVARSLPDFGVRFEALLEMPIESFEADACPLCARGAPIIDPGSRRA